ncbi:HpcH/HpaI aldolase/citrate lyase family protein [Ramlibacter sp.]|uniref:HpcH/HpaI aldolase/citrate lyase family protein n=1 Tax=Ramlibacter sp. TaxID=1917967 RepID=UPI003D0FA1CB
MPKIAAIRSLMFVPGHRESMIDKCAAAGADAVVLDLEDSVPGPDKVAARELVAGKLAGLAAKGQRTYVRINRTRHLYSFEDILAVVQPGLEGIMLSMPDGPLDVAIASALVAEAEERNGVAEGSVGIIPALETPRGLQHAWECAQAERVVALVGASAKNADLQRAMEWEWQEDSLESKYMKSRVIMACRAAGKQPIGGIWQQVHDLDGLRRYAQIDRKLGMGGTTILHPSNAAVVNEIFMPTAEDVAYYEGMVKAYEEGLANGRASVMYKGEHIDTAHFATAKQKIALARSLRK